jgi:dTDP-4-dehydrorhamnose reductase
LAFKIFLTEIDSPLAQALLHELEHHTFAVVMPNQGAICVLEQSLDEPGVVIDSRVFGGITHGVEPDHCLPVIHLSSFEVFAQESNNPGFLEPDQPRGFTPRALALIEAETRALERKSVVLRLPFLLDMQVGHWFEALMTRLTCEPWVSVSETARLDPVCVKEVCRVVIAIAQQIACGAENWGVMHLRSAEPCFEAEFADHLVRQLKKEQWPGPVAQLDVGKTPSIWVGPVNVLAGRRLTDTFGVQMRSWRLGVKALLQQWLDERRPAAVTSPEPLVPQ